MREKRPRRLSARVVKYGPVVVQADTLGVWLRLRPLDMSVAQRMRVVMEAVRRMP